jgi:multidrug efflux pump subunit AcrA (membrane-fusion protein)
VTEATLITDKANIEATRITLAQAQDQLSQATITSPIAGKVASIPFILGQQASATASAVIIGTGAIEVAVPVPLAKRPQIATNQTSTVTSSVGGTALTGTISRISLLPTSTGFSLAAATTGAAGAAAANSATTSTTYATVITVPSGGDLLPEGSRVQASITTKTVDAKVVLPASAVTPTGSTSATVQVLNGTTVTVKRIVMGAVGDAYVEIVSGLNVGETVIIADTTIPIAAASIQTGRPSQTAVQPTGGFDPAQGGVPPGGGGVPTGGGAAPTR